MTQRPRLLSGVAALCAAIVGLAVLFTAPAISKDDEAKKKKGAQGLVMHTIGL